MTMARSVRGPRSGGPLLAALLAVLAASASGCLGSGGQNEPIRFWVLGALPGPPDPVAEKRVLGLGPIDLPAHLDRPGIVTREGENRLRVAALDQWGEPLSRGVARVLSENFAVLDPGLETISFPWKGPVTPALQLAMNVTRFDARLGGEVELLVSWVITRTEDSAELALDSSWVKVSTSADDIAGVVSAMSRAVEQLSRELAPVVREAFARATPAPGES
jgi:uncharacterized lipoprotein YmbA